MATARDLLLDSVTGDLAIVSGDLAIVYDYDAIVSDIKATISMVAGEWFLDLSQGIPWFQIFGTKKLSLTTIRAQIFTAIAARRGVTQVRNVDVTINRNLRTLTVNWTAYADATLLGGTVKVSP